VSSSRCAFRGSPAVGCSRAIWDAVAGVVAWVIGGLSASGPARLPGRWLRWLAGVSEVHDSSCRAHYSLELLVDGDLAVNEAPSLRSALQHVVVDAGSDSGCRLVTDGEDHVAALTGVVPVDVDDPVAGAMPSVDYGHVVSGE
jgi:hypothetical protein